ncbi:MAG: hypothetical protein U0X20_26070 [Caldilineaceae bacterium]
MEEVQNRRTREYQIFSWTSGLLVALIGALLVFPRAPQTIWSSYGVAGRLLAALAVAIFALQSIAWQLRNRQAAQDNARAVVRINRLFHLFEPGYFDAGSDQSVLPPQWQEWGSKALATESRSIFGEIGAGLFGANFISPTLLLAVVAVLMILAT